MSLTVAIVGNINHNLMSFNLQKTLNSVPYDEILICSDVTPKINAEFNYVEIPKSQDFGIQEYNKFIFTKLSDLIQTDHVLIIQHDSMACNPYFWDDSFLNFDYIGCPSSMAIPMIQNATFKYAGFSVDDSKLNQWFNGGGGFSIRSKKLLTILKEFDFPYFITSYQGTRIFCEDLQISNIHRRILEKNHGIEFAPLDVCMKFGTEHVPHNFCMGFHGWDNYPLFVSEKELIDLMDNLEYFFINKEYLKTNFLINTYKMNYQEAATKFQTLINNLSGNRFSNLNNNQTHNEEPSLLQQQIR